MIYLQLYHGRPIDPKTGNHPDLENWGEDGPIFELTFLSVTYNGGPHLIKYDPGDTPPGHVARVEVDSWLEYHEDLIFYDGMGYGDWSVESGVPEGGKVVAFDPEKARIANYLTQEAVDLAYKETHRQFLPDGDYVLMHGKAWLEAGPFAVRVNRTDEGIIADIYESGSECDNPLGSTYVFDNEIPEKE